MKHTPTKALQVSLDFGSKQYVVGQLLLNEYDILFEFAQSFLQTNLAFSPFKLPLTAGVHKADSHSFEGLFGVFNDSLPDGWGRLLLDRQVQHLGIPPQSLTPLDRLAYVGKSGMGALHYEPTISTHQQDISDLKLDKLAEESQLVLTGSPDAFFEELLTLSGASSGARPKIIAAVSKDKKNIQTSNSSSDVEDWLIKFNALNDFNDMAQIEYAYSLMAKDAGIEMPETHLFTTKQGAYFASKCFDRAPNSRLHMHTLSGLLHADHRAPSIDYEIALRCTNALTKNIIELEKHFKLAVFNVLAHNRDDHTKNFAYLMDSEGNWKFAPAYDLTFSYGPGGEQSMMVEGEGKNPTKKHLRQLGKKFDIKKVDDIISEIASSVKNWKNFAETAGVTKSSTLLISKVLLQ